MNDRTPISPPDFATLFAAGPNPYLVLDCDLVIVAVNDAYCRATMTLREDILGRGIFDVFPDNPDDRHTTGTGNLHASLMRVLEYGRPDAMAVQKYDIRKPASQGGTFEVRYWSPLNTPVLDKNGAVQWIIHYVEDVTEIVQTRMEESEKAALAKEQMRIRRVARRQSRTCGKNGSGRALEGNCRQHRYVVGRFFPTARLANNGVARYRAFQRPADPDVIKSAAAVRGFPITGAVAPPGVDFLLRRHEGPSDVLPVETVEGRIQQFGFNGRMAYDI
jgi:hypothetical protein